MAVNIYTAKYGAGEEEEEEEWKSRREFLGILRVLLE
jgi:hypothetical protein